MGFGAEIFLKENPSNQRFPTSCWPHLRADWGFALGQGPGPLVAFGGGIPPQAPIKETNICLEVQSKNSCNPKLAKKYRFGQIPIFWTILQRSTLVDTCI